MHVREPYTRYTFVNLVVLPLGALALVAGLKWFDAKNSKEARQLAEIFIGSLTVLVIVAWARFLARRRKIEAHKRVVRLSRQSGVNDQLIAMTQLWSDEYLRRLQRELDQEDSQRLSRLRR